MSANECYTVFIQHRVFDTNLFLDPLKLKMGTSIYNEIDKTPGRRVALIACESVIASYYRSY